MGIRKRQGKFGETSEYHYEFMQNGKRYYGVCEGCTTKIAAANYEKKVKETVKKLAEQNNATALVQNFKRELVGGQNITIDDAFSIYLQKPSKRLRGKKQVSAKQAHWNDFCAFLKEHYPEIQTLDRVTRSHAEEYIGLLKSQGRFVREIQNGKKAAYKKNYPMQQSMYIIKPYGLSSKSSKKMQGCFITRFHLRCWKIPIRRERLFRWKNCS